MEATGPQGVAGAALRFAAAFVLFALLTGVLFWPWMAHLSSALIGPPEDNLQDFWNSWYAAVGSDPHHFFQTDLIRFPEGTALYYHSFAYTQLFVLVALSRIFGSDHATLVLLHNATLLLSFPLAGTGAFYLVRHFAKAQWASLAGGYVFAFNPSHVAHVMHHAHVASIGFIPFFVLAYLKAQESRSIAWLAAAVALLALCALSCWYYLFYLTFFVLFHTIWLCVRENKLPSGWRLAIPVSTLGGAALLLSPLLLPMIRQSDPNAYYVGTNIFVADFAGYFVFPPTHLLSAWTQAVFARIATDVPWESVVYLGLINVGLIAWLVLQRNKDPVRAYVLWGMAVFCVIAAGETPHVLGHAFSFIHLPDVILAKLPFFANVRTPSRAVVMVYLFLAIGVGYALPLAKERGAIARPVIGVAVVLLVLDFYPAHLQMTDAACPKALDIFARDSERGFGVLNLPGGYVEGNAAMAQQTCHGRPIVQGNVARQLAPTLGDRLQASNLAAQQAQLIRSHVKYIVLMPESNGLFVWHKEDGDRADYASAYRAAYRGPEMTILRVY